MNGSPHPSLDAEEPTGGERRGGSVAGRLVVAAIVLGFVVFVGVRIKAALETRAAVAAERDEQARTAGAPPVDVLVKPVAATWRPVVPVEGTLRPLHETDLGFKVGGRLAAIYVHEGDAVRAGQTLAVLDDGEARAQLDAARASERAAEAQLSLAGDTWKRTEKALAGGAMAEAAGIQAQAQHQLAEAQRDGAKAQRELAEKALANHRLVAPFAGSVTKAPQGTGAIVAPGAALFHLADTAKLELVGTVGAEDAGLVRLGAALTVASDGVPLVGRVKAILPSLDAMRRLPIEAEVEARPHAGPTPIADESDTPGLTAAARAGAFVRATVDGGAAIPVLRVPPTVLRPGSQDEVLVVDGGKVRARRIRFSVDADGSLLVRAGLSASDALVVSPAADRKDGDAVHLDTDARQ